MAKNDKKSSDKKKIKKNFGQNGVVHIKSSFNNTIVTISDVSGNAVSWSSSGSMGFRGSKKSTPYAAQPAADDVAKKAQDHGVKRLKSQFKVQARAVKAHFAPWLLLVSTSHLSVT